MTTFHLRGDDTPQVRRMTAHRLMVHLFDKPLETGERQTVVLWSPAKVIASALSAVRTSERKSQFLEEKVLLCGIEFKTYIHFRFKIFALSWFIGVKKNIVQVWHNIGLYVNSIRDFYNTIKRLWWFRKSCKRNQRFYSGYKSIDSSVSIFEL